VSSYLWKNFPVFLSRHSAPFLICRGPCLTSLWPPGVNLAPRVEICPLGGMFTPLFAPRG
jgi:hypothetical protein